MKILGIDPGIHKVGFGIVEKNDGSFNLVKSGFIKPPSSLSYKNKLSYIANKIEEIILKWKVNFIAIEEIYLAKNVQIALKIGQVIGIIESVAIRYNIDFDTIAPREIKKCLTGRGSAEKQQVKFMVETITGYNNFKNTDESDAVAVAISYFYIKKENDLLHKGKNS